MWDAIHRSASFRKGNSRIRGFPHVISWKVSALRQQSLRDPAAEWNLP
ncbi:MAG: hypothetical protein ACK5TY_02415 [Verrucomicrobiota bacterium]